MNIKKQLFYYFLHFLSFQLLVYKSKNEFYLLKGKKHNQTHFHFHFQNFSVILIFQKPLFCHHIQAWGSDLQLGAPYFSKEYVSECLASLTEAVLRRNFLTRKYPCIQKHIPKKSRA